MQMLANSLWKFECNLMCIFNVYIDIETRCIPNMNLVQYIIGIKAETR